MNVHVVVGTKQNVYQDTIGGPFETHPDKEIVKIFSDENKAKNFIENAKLAKPKKERYGDTSYYRGGYEDMEIETYSVENN
jgi:hypothetical protein